MKKLFCLLIGAVALLIGCIMEDEYLGENPYEFCDLHFTPNGKSVVFELTSFSEPHTPLCLPLLSLYAFDSYEEYAAVLSDSDQTFMLATYSADCANCKELTPYFLKLAQKYKNSGLRFAILFLSSDGKEATVADLGQDTNGAPYTQKTLENVEVFTAPLGLAIRGVGIEVFPSVFPIAEEKVYKQILTLYAKRMMIGITPAAQLDITSFASPEILEPSLHQLTRQFCQSLPSCKEPALDELDNEALLHGKVTPMVDTFKFFSLFKDLKTKEVEEAVKNKLTSVYTK